MRGRVHRGDLVPDRPASTLGQGISQDPVRHRFGAQFGTCLSRYRPSQTLHALICPRERITPRVVVSGRL
jgi:hypothetical protein